MVRQQCYSGQGRGGEPKTHLARQDHVAYALLGAQFLHARPGVVHDRVASAWKREQERVGVFAMANAIGDVPTRWVARWERSGIGVRGKVVLRLEEMPFADLDRLSVLRNQTP